MSDKNPIKGIKNVVEAAKAVGEYQVVIGAMTISVKVLYYYDLPTGMQYMAVPSHSLLVEGGQTYHPLRNYASEEEAARDLIMEFGI
jgi:hypothetical protein